MPDAFIPFFRPDIDEGAVAAVGETLRSGWLTSGPGVRKFEQRFAEYVEAEHAVAVNSCTAGLHLALASLGISAGDEVIVPTMTFAATAEVAIHLGARPVLVDIDGATLNMDPEALEVAIGPRTRAIVPVHYGGHPAAMDRIMELACASGVPVVEDAAHALPAAYKGQTVGTIGTITAFSFYANKTITTGEGGMVTTADPTIAERIRMLSLHGLSNDAWDRFSERGAWDYDIALAGYKYNLTDIAAAIGIAQLERSDEFHEARTRQAARYNAHFSDLPIVQPLEVAPDTTHAWHLYAIVLDTDRLTITRNELIELLRESGIGTSVHYRPLHLHSLYRTAYGYRPEDLPTATSRFPRLLSLPIYPKLRDDELDRVADTLKQVIRDHRR